MKNKPVLLTATFIAKKKKDASALFARLEALIEPTRKEKGCVDYRLHRDINDPCRFTFIEQFKSQAAFETHLKKPYIRALKDLKPEVYFYDEVFNG